MKKIVVLSELSIEHSLKHVYTHFRDNSLVMTTTRLVSYRARIFE